MTASATSEQNDTAAPEVARANAVALARQAAAQAAAAGCARDAEALERIADRLEAAKPRRKLKPAGSPGARLRAEMAKRGA